MLHRHRKRARAFGKRVDRDALKTCFKRAPLARSTFRRVRNRRFRVGLFMKVRESTMFLRSLFNVRAASPALTRLSLCGVALGATAIANWLVARSSEHRHPPMGGFISIRGVRLHYVVLGPKDSSLPPAVLLHGNGATAHDFVDSGVAKLLARERRVIIFDRPGAGYSERPRG